jgi:methyl acetate hydrolase
MYSNPVSRAGKFPVLSELPQRPMKVDTIVRIASMTKAITSVAIMQLVEQEKLQLDDSVGQYLPGFADAQVLEGFDADDKPILRPATSPVTVRHLLTHTLGYLYEIWNADAGRNAALGNVASISAGGAAFKADIQSTL